MAKEGVGTKIRDDEGNVFVLEKEIGQGVQGKVYLAGSEFSEQVAIKHYYIDPTDPDRHDQYAAIQREIQCLQKVGKLISIKSPEENDRFLNTYIAMPYYAGEDLREVMYELNGPDGTVSGKRPLTRDQKDFIAYSLLREAALAQEVGIVYVDYKPENILVNFENKIFALIDYGQAFMPELQESPHKDFQDGGVTYTVPEAEKDPAAIKNSFETDGYVIGIMIAALYSDACYESAVGRPRPGFALSARAVLSDVLGDEVNSKEGMPQDLFEIVRHLMQVEPDKRPPCIALANGIEASPLAEELAMQRRAHAVEDMIKKLDDLLIQEDDKKGKGKGKVKEKMKSVKSVLTLHLAKSKKASKEVPNVPELISAAIQELRSMRPEDSASIEAAHKMLEQLRRDIDGAKTISGKEKLALKEKLNRIEQALPAAESEASASRHKR